MTRAITESGLTWAWSVPRGRPAYLRTYADGDWNNNLLSLDQCPSSCCSPDGRQRDPPPRARRGHEDPGARGRRAASRARRAAFSDTSLREPRPSQRSSPSLVLSVSIDPVLRRCALHDEIETVAVSIFTGPCFAFDVEQLEFACHVFPLAKSVLRTHG
jgi:hypothetical protein